MARTYQYSASIMPLICNFFINFAFYSNAYLKNDRIVITKTYGESRKNFGNILVVVTSFGRPSDTTRMFPFYIMTDSEIIYNEDGLIVNCVSGVPLKDTPEERVRQRFIRIIQTDYGYPKEHIRREIPIQSGSKILLWE